MLTCGLSLCHFHKILMIPTFVSPLKSIPTLPNNARLKIVKHYVDTLRCSKNIDIECLDYELNQKKTCYTVDTLAWLKVTYPQTTFYMLIGSDQFFQLHRWKQYETILKNIILCVVKREDDFFSNLDEYKNKYINHCNYKAIIFIKNDIISISSTDIRNDISNKEYLKTVVPTAVFNILESKK